MTDNAAFTYDELISAGRTRSALEHARRTGALVTPFRGIYLDGTPSDQLTLIRAAYRQLGPECVVVVKSAIAVHGIAGLVGAAIPELAMPPGLERRQREGMRIRFRQIPFEDVTSLNGLRVTTVVRTLADVLRETPRMQGVACVDSALHLGLATYGDLPMVGAMMMRQRGCVSGRRWLVQARLGAQSPLETRVRLCADDGGLPPDELQVPIHDESGRLLGYGDIGWRLANGKWLIAEADGREFHDTPAAVLNDRHRQNAFLAAADAQIVRFTWDDTNRAGYIASVLRPILLREGWQGFKPVRP